LRRTLARTPTEGPLGVIKTLERIRPVEREGKKERDKETNVRRQGKDATNLGQEVSRKSTPPKRKSHEGSCRWRICFKPSQKKGGMGQGRKYEANPSIHPQ